MQRYPVNVIRHLPFGQGCALEGFVLLDAMPQRQDELSPALNCWILSEGTSAREVIKDQSD